MLHKEHTELASWTEFETNVGTTALSSCSENGFVWDISPTHTHSMMTVTISRRHSLRLMHTQRSLDSRRPTYNAVDWHNTPYFYSSCTMLRLSIWLHTGSVYSVSQKNPPYCFLKFFPKRLEIFNQFLHTYYTNISTLDYKFLFKYLQLW